MLGFFFEGNTLFEKILINLDLKKPENAKVLVSPRQGVSGKGTHTKHTNVATGWKRLPNRFPGPAIASLWPLVQRTQCSQYLY